MSDVAVDQLRQAGMAALAAGDHRRAADSFGRASALRPRDADLSSRQALALLSAGDLTAARRVALASATVAAGNAAALDRLGHVLCRTRDFQQGYDLFRQAAELAPANPAILKNLAWGAQYVGDLEAAEHALRQALSMAPDDGMAWSTLSGLPGWRPTDAELDRLRALADRPMSVQDGLAIGHALARGLERREDFVGALAALDRPKRLRLRQKPYDVARDLDLFEAARTAYATGPAGEGDPTSAPIFVVGPPRSGTTLLDRILSCHAEVVSAGELGVMMLLVKDTAGLPGAGPLTAQAVLRAAASQAAAMARRYLGAARVVVGSAPHFIDKRPFNLILAGYIHRMMPQARIIRMRRNPADTVLGNYRQFFNVGSPHHDYSYDLADAARYVAGAEALSEFWESVLPKDRYRVIDYEALVAEPRTQIADALAFCGLGWDPACLEFHRNEAGVSTASAAQVREPLHDRNIGLWRRYGAGMEPALDVLRAAGRLTD